VPVASLDRRALHLGRSSRNGNRDTQRGSCLDLFTSSGTIASNSAPDSANNLDSQV
jgi:hypothetical protein